MRGRPNALLLLLLSSILGAVGSCKSKFHPDAAVEDQPPSSSSRPVPEPPRESLPALGRRASTDTLALQALLAALRSPHDAVWGPASTWLSKAGPPAVGPLIPILGDSSATMRRRAAYALGQMGATGARAFPQLRRLVGERNDTVAGMADWAIQQMGPGRRDRFILLVESVRWDTGYAQAESVRKLGELGEAARDGVPALINTLASRSSIARTAAVDALVKVGPSAIPHLEHALGDNNVAIREGAALALVRLRKPTF